MSHEFLLGLEKGGFTQPHRVANSFGMEMKHIPASLSLMGNMYIFQPEHLQSCMSLIMISRWSILGTIEKDEAITKP